LRVRSEKGTSRPRRRVRKRRLAALLLVLLRPRCCRSRSARPRGRERDPALDPAAQHSDVDTVVYASNGRTVLAVLRGDESRVLVNTEDIAPIMRQAIVSVEDQRFFEHNGIDVRGVARALWQDVRSRASSRAARRSRSSS
jgi:membrane peptidoglycan carboxypeptidase